jgi:predicted O-methyltransferase YrrM
MALFEEKFPEIERYLEDNASAEPDILKRLRKETFQKTTQPHMISGYLQGRFLSILSHILNPKNVLEIGTFTGYATLSMAEGLAEGGKIYTLDKNEDLAYLPQNILMKANIMLRLNLF